MIKIKGNFAEAIIYSDSLDTDSEGLIKALCNSIIAENSKIRVMPDVHPGKGCAVGMTMTLENRVAPGLVGVDISCGMEVVNVKAKKLEIQQLDKLIQSKIPSGMNIRQTPHRFAETANLERLKCAKNIRIEKSLLGIGTLGGGNHFIELDKSDSGYYLIIHSGSRHLGVEVERYYHEIAYERTKGDVPYEFAYLEGELFEDYLFDMRIVQNFASLNRQAMAADIVKGMKFTEIERFSTVHNYIDTDNKILRKNINDNYDSYDKIKDSDMIIPFKNIINAVYSKDISRKVISSLSLKQHKGEFLGNYPPYGYALDENRCFIKDEYASETVNRIFDMFIAGVTMSKICKNLTYVLYTVSLNKDNTGYHHDFKEYGLRKIKIKNN